MYYFLLARAPKFEYFYDIHVCKPCPLHDCTAAPFCYYKQNYYFMQIDTKRSYVKGNEKMLMYKLSDGILGIPEQIVFSRLCDMENSTTHKRTVTQKVIRGSHTPIILSESFVKDKEIRASAASAVK